MITLDPKSRSRRSWGPLEPFLKLFSSIWLGVTLLLTLFVYASIGSAGVLLPKGLALGSETNWIQFQIREYRGLEMTEFEWFHWWPFDLLIGLICLNLVVATLRRIPFKPVNYGVWMIHTGIIMLAASSVYYFGTKVEGDAAVTRRAVAIDVPGHETVSMAAVPGSTAEVGDYRFATLETNPAWEILSGDDKGRRTYKVSVLVRHGEEQFMRELLAGYPQYTEDVVPTGDPRQPMARARKVLEKPLVDETLHLSLQLEPQGHFHLVNSWAMHLREVGREDWVERPIDGLPRFNDYVTAPDDVWPSAGLEPDPLSIDVPPASPDDPLPDATLRVDCYLRYAVMQSRRVVGGERLDPVVSLQVAPPGREGSFDLQLVALDRANNQDLGIRFEWADTAAARSALRERVTPAMTVLDAGGAPLHSHPVTHRAVITPEAPFLAVPGTDYEYRVAKHEDNLQLPDGQVVSVAVLEVRTPDRSFVRWVFDDPRRANVDFAPSGTASALHGDEIELDEGLRLGYRPGVAGLFVAGPEPESLVLVTAGEGGEVAETPVAPGERHTLPDGTALAVTKYAPRTVEQTRPAIVPRAQRQREASVQFAKIRVGGIPVADGGPARVWLPYSHYVFERPDEVLFRYPFETTRLRLDDGREVEMAFSRRRLPLPTPVALEDFHMVEHVGGFTGGTLSIRDWISELRFATGDGGWTGTHEVRSNHPIGHAGYWYFQAAWDPPDQERGSGGLNYTVLGVGNRNGVNLMLASCCVSVLGMIYAFYIKPIIKRRRQRAVYDRAAATRETSSPPAAAPAALEPVGALKEGA